MKNFTMSKMAGLSLLILLINFHSSTVSCSPLPWSSYHSHNHHHHHVPMYSSESSEEETETVPIKDSKVNVAVSTENSRGHASLILTAIASRPTQSAEVLVHENETENDYECHANPDKAHTETGSANANDTILYVERFLARSFTTPQCGKDQVYSKFQKRCIRTFLLKYPGVLG